jgi:hypothetical protein
LSETDTGPAGYASWQKPGVANPSYAAYTWSLLGGNVLF